MFFVIFVLFLIFAGVLTVITVQNLDTPVMLAMFTWHTPSLPLGLVVVFSFVLGALLLYVVSLLSAWREGRQIKQLRQRIAQLEQGQVSNMAPASLPATGMSAVPMPGMPEPDATMQPPASP
jgi:uncharacterized integral membrane protein